MSQELADWIAKTTNDLGYPSLNQFMVEVFELVKQNPDRYLKLLPKPPPKK